MACDGGNDTVCFVSHQHSLSIVDLFHICHVASVNHMFAFLLFIKGLALNKVYLTECGIIKVAKFFFIIIFLDIILIFKRNKV